jgi:EAL domain-containing protein (putative c-di-GMP-specific phosphodiesterase class I)/CheY-like chemotaxis protein
MSTSSTSSWPELGSPRTSDAPPPSERSRVLLVDDDQLVARGYERTLRAAGYAVEVSTDCSEAIARFKKSAFDVIISDIKMPHMTGLDLLRAIREHDLDVPVIIMTGGPDVQTASEAIEYGALRYLIKPVDPVHLEEVVGRAVRLHQMARVRKEAVEQYHARGRQLGDRAGLEKRFSSAISNLWMAYQPIVSWAGRSLFAYEALVRTEETTLRNPADLFDAAERLDRLHELGQVIRRHVAETIPTIPSTMSIFVNVHPADLQDETLFDPAAPLSAHASRVVLEITERAALDKVSDLMGRMAQLRSMGYRIAVDDLGAGYAGLTSFAQLEPEIVKVDMSIVRGIDRSATKQKMLGSIIRLCNDLKIQLIAEGIETPSERDAVVGLGGDLCQGYLFARPGKPFPVPTWTDPVVNPA